MPQAGCHVFAAGTILHCCHSTGLPQSHKSNSHKLRLLCLPQVYPINDQLLTDFPDWAALPPPNITWAADINCPAMEGGQLCWKGIALLLGRGRGGLDHDHDPIIPF